MNSLINAATSVTETAKAAVWGKPEAESGTEPPNEDLSLSKSSSKPYDPGNTTDTAPTSPATETAPEPATAIDAATIPVAIPAPGSDDPKPVEPTDGATAVPAPAEEGDKAEKKADDTKAPAETEAPKTPAKTPVAAVSKGRDESPASTPGSSSKRGFRSKLKEKLHIGSGKNSPQS